MVAMVHHIADKALSNFQVVQGVFMSYINIAAIKISTSMIVIEERS